MAPSSVSVAFYGWIKVLVILNYLTLCLCAVIPPPDPVAFYGWTKVPRDPDVLFQGITPNPVPYSVDDFPLPTSELVREADALIKAEVTEQIYDHSVRTYIYASSIVKTHFPEWNYDPETFYLAALLHDIATTDKVIRSSKLSFEYIGGILARDFLLSKDAPQDQADSVAEAIIRHTDDSPDGGNISTLGQLMQLGTHFDILAQHSEFFHPDFIKSVSNKYPLRDWPNSFYTGFAEEELSLKPWCHFTSYERANWNVGDPSQTAQLLKNLTDTFFKPYNIE